MLPGALLLALASLPFLPSPSAAQTQIPTPTSGCTGCVGTGGSAASSGGSCGGMVSISVTVSGGKCRWYMGEAGDISCRQQKACVPEITRSWSGMSPASDLDFCVVLEGEPMCLSPKPSAGASGAGSDTRGSAGMGCSNDSAGSRQFSLASPSCGLSASAQASCSGCSGSL